MPRATPLLTTFNAGEWDPALYGRPDLAKYANACRALTNFLPMAQGPATRRTGSHFVAPTRGDLVGKLIPFEFSTEQAYQIEATDLAFRFHKDRARIESPPGAPVEIVTPYAEALLPALKWVQSADVLYLVDGSQRQQLLSRTSHVAWSITPFDFLDGPYLDQNTTATTLDPAAATGTGIAMVASSIAGINGGQGFLATDAGRLIRLKNGATWGYCKIATVVDPLNLTVDIISDFAAATANAAWRLGAWSDTTGWPKAVGFFDERLYFGGTRTQPQTSWGSVSGDFPNFAPTDLSGAVLPDSAVTFTIADSLVNAILAFAPGDTLIILTNSGPFEFKPASQNESISAVNPPSAKRVGRPKAADQMALKIGLSTLYVERSGKQLHELVYRFDLGANGAYATPERTLLARHIARPRLLSLDFQDDPFDVVWSPRADGVLAGMTFMPDQDVIAWHRHPLGGRHVDAAGVAQPFAKVLSASVIPGNGQDELWLIVERVIAGQTRRYVEYLEYEFAPRNVDDKDGCWFVDAGLNYDGTVATAVLTPGADADQQGAAAVPFAASIGVFDAAMVGREIRHVFDVALPDGSTRSHRARARIDQFVTPQAVKCTILTPFPPPAPIAAGLWALSAATVTQLGHLEGETVQILADGATHPDRTVSGGAVMLERQAQRVQVGLGYESRLESMNLEGLGRLAGLKRVVKAAVKLLNSLGCKVGYDDAHLEEIPFRAANDPMDESPPLFTGDKLVEFPKGFEREARVLVTQTLPLPCTVSAIGLDVESNG